MPAEDCSPTCFAELSPVAQQHAQILARAQHPERQWHYLNFKLWAAVCAGAARLHPLLHLHARVWQRIQMSDIRYGAFEAGVSLLLVRRCEYSAAIFASMICYS